MNYTAIGIMSGSSMDGLDIACIKFSEHDGKWKFKIKAAKTTSFSAGWLQKLPASTGLAAKDYLLLHTAFGKYCGQKVSAFLKENKINGKIDCIGFHGHTTFHLPMQNMTHQLGDGAALTAVTGIAVVSDLRAMDVALGGQGAPIVPIGEKLLFAGYDFYLNLGGIANISIHNDHTIDAFDICPANRVLNMLAGLKGRKFDKNGTLSSKGTMNNSLLKRLNSLKYYHAPYPKSLDNDFGTKIVFPIVRKYEKNINDALATYTEHIAQQVGNVIRNAKPKSNAKLLVTGGGAFNKYLVSRIACYCAEADVDVIVPDKDIINYKEALVMALMAVLRQRDEVNVLSSVTGATRDSCNGALWNGRMPHHKSVK